MSAKTAEQYRQVINRCLGIFKKKCLDYDTAWRIMRLPSFTDQIFIKAKRICTIQQKKQRVAEGVETELIGIINYAVLALIQIKRKDDLRMSIPCEEVCGYYEACVEQIMALLAQKNHDYDEAWREMRVSSMVDIILMKLLRIKQIEDNEGQTIISEGIVGGYQDIVNYAVFASILLVDG